MQYVQVSVPKELYDKLGLHLNQTITLRSSQNMCELDTRVNSNSSDGDLNEHHRLLLTKPGIKSCIVDEGTKQISFKKPDGTFQVIQVNNVGNTEPNVSTVEENSNSQLMNSSQSSSDDDPGDHENMSTIDFHAASCDMPVGNMSELNECSIGETSQYSIGSPNMPQALGVGACKKKMVAGNAKKQIVISDGNVKHCEICALSFTTHAALLIHKRECGLQRAKELPYFRMCTVCHRCYYHRMSFLKHKPLCKKFSRRQLNLNQNSVLQRVSSSSISELNASLNDTSASNSSGDLKDSTEESHTSIASAKWIPCNSNFKNAQNFFIVKNKQ